MIGRPDPRSESSGCWQLFNAWPNIIGHKKCADLPLISSPFGNSILFRDILRWLTVLQWIQVKIAFLTFNCVHGTNHKHFQHICTPTASLSDQAGLRSAEHGDLAVPRTASELGEVSALPLRSSGTVFRIICARPHYPREWFAWTENQPLPAGLQPLCEFCDEEVITVNWTELTLSGHSTVFSILCYSTL